jgi:hypothetical protein
VCSSDLLCVLVHRRAVDIARREASRRARDERQPPPPVASYTAEELLFLRFDRRRVQEALRQLPVPQRDLVELAYWGGLTQAQLAERLKLPLGTVKSRMFSALNVLRAALVLNAGASPSPASGKAGRRPSAGNQMGRHPTIHSAVRCPNSKVVNRCRSTDDRKERTESTSAANQACRLAPNESRRG